MKKSAKSTGKRTKAQADTAESDAPLDVPPAQDGPGRPSMTAEAVAERHRQIVASKIRGVADSNIAATFNVDESTVRKVWRDYKAGRPQLKSLDPIDLVEDMVEQYTGAAEELALIAASAKQESVRVGAIRARLDAMRQKTELLQAVGVLPHDLGKLRVEMDMRLVATRVLHVVSSLGLADEDRDQLLEAITGQPIQQG